MKLQNVSIEAKANTYFDGKVNSRNIYLADGHRITLGFMQAGEYTFSTGDKELMTLLGGDIKVLLPGESEWRQIDLNEEFEVPANSSFSVIVKEFADYHCDYIK